MHPNKNKLGGEMEYLEDKEEKRIQALGVGDKFITKWSPISEGLIDIFVRLIGIDHPLFLNNEYAKSLGFKSRISTGILTFAYMMGLLFKSGLIRDGIYLGTDKCTHKLPVYPGDMIRGEIELLNKRVTSKGDRIVMSYHWQVRNQDDQVVSEGINTCMFPARW
jgi:acyl dehydratase